MIRGIFFDLFGTLFIYGDMKKAWSDWLYCLYSSMQDCGLEISMDEFSKECDMFFGEKEPTFIDNDLTIFEKRIKELSSSLRLTISKGDICSIANITIDKWQNQISLDTEAIPTIKQLKKDRIIGLVSNFDHPPHVRRYLSKYNMDALFDAVVISGEVGVKKPNPKIFEPALTETNLKANEVAYVGDTIGDIEAARAANIKPILIVRMVKRTDNKFVNLSVEQLKEFSGNNVDTRVISKLPELMTIFKQK